MPTRMRITRSTLTAGPTPLVGAHALALLLLGGCSALYSTDGERLPGPTTPELSIEPAAPRTLDDLHALVTTESVDPLGHTVRYQYSWMRDGDGTAHEGDTLDDALTSKGDRWTVTVTPIADTRRGRSATASVTIENTPPTLAYAGFVRYDVFRDESIELFFGPATDPDGDTVTQQIAWQADGSDLNEHGATLPDTTISASTARGFTASIVPNDGQENGNLVTVGPAVVRGPGTQFRQLIPERGGVDVLSGLLFAGNGPNAFHDPANARWVVRMVDSAAPVQSEAVQLWEYAADTGRWARLVRAHETANPTTGGWFDGVDLDRRLAYVVPPGTTTTPRPAVQILHFDVRGGERWEEMPIAADSPVPGNFLGGITYYDAKRQRILVLGSGLFGETLTAGWAVSVQGPEARWTKLWDSSPLGIRVAPTIVPDPSGDAVYLLGGLLFTSNNGNATGTADTAIYRLDLLEDTVDPTPVGQLATPLLEASAIRLADTSRYLVLGGAVALSGVSPPSPIVFDTATRTTAPYDGSGALATAPLGAYPALGTEPSTGRLVVGRVAGYQPDWQRGMAFYTFDVATGDRAVLEEYGSTSPAALSMTKGYGTGYDFRILFGRRATRESPNVLTEDHCWAYQGETGRFASADLPTQPPGRYGFATGYAYSSGRYVIGGTHLVGGVASFDRTVYTHLPSGASAWAPVGQLSTSDDFTGALVHSCAGSTFALVGGEAARAGTRPPVSSVSCTTGVCTVTPTSQAATYTGGTIGAFHLYSSALMNRVTFGGYGTTTATLFSIADPCGTAAWSSTAGTGTPSNIEGGTVFRLPDASPSDTTDTFVVVASDTTSIKVWQLVITPSAVTWTPITTATPEAPGPRFYFASSASDPDVTRTALLYGGQSDRATAQTFQTFSDLWELRIDAP